MEFHTIPIGCDSCHYTGYKGRVAIYELLNMDSEISDIIKKDINQLQQVLQPKGFKTLSDRAFELIQEGETSIEEVYSILMN